MGGVGKQRRRKESRSEARRWDPFVRASYSEETLQKLRASIEGTSVPLGAITGDEIHLNNRYEVTVFWNAYQFDQWDPVPGWPRVAWLSIKRRDKEPLHDWRDLQRIKSEVVGPDFEAIELYPSESRVVDTANQYHLFVFLDPEFRLPFGWKGGARFHGSDPGLGAKQRPYPVKGGTPVAHLPCHHGPPGEEAFATTTADLAAKIQRGDSERGSHG